LAGSAEVWGGKPDGELSLLPKPQALRVIPRAKKKSEGHEALRLRAPRVCPATQRPAQSSFPSGGFSLACRRTLRVDPETRCLPWSSVPLGVLSADESRGYWVPRSRHGLGFSPGPPRSLFVRRPPHLSMRFHPPSSFPPPSESCGLRAAPRAPIEPRDPIGQPKSASLGVLVPHRDVSKRRPPLRRESRPSGHVPSSTFLTSSTVSSATCLCGLVSSRCHVQGLPFRGLSLAAEPYQVSPADSCPPGVERGHL